MAELNFTIETVVGLISLVVSFITFGLIFRQYGASRQQYALYMCLTWCWNPVWIFFQVLSKLFLDPFYYKLMNFIIAVETIFITMMWDSLYHEKVEPKKMSISVFLATAIFFTAFQPDSVFFYTSPGGITSITMSGIFSLFVALVYIWGTGVLMISLMAGIRKHAPQSLRKNATIGLGGTMIIFGGGISVMAKLTVFVPGIHMFLIAVGFSLISYEFYKNPKLAYILPSKVHTLLVMNTISGIPVYKYEWSKMEFIDDESLFSAMLQGIRIILGKSVKKGNVREIKLDEGILLLEYRPEENVAAILVSSKSTLPLKSGISKFLDAFCTKYHDILKTPDISEITKADEIVEKCFPFIPSYK